MPRSGRAGAARPPRQEPNPDDAANVKRWPLLLLPLMSVSVSCDRIRLPKAAEAGGAPAVAESAGMPEGGVVRELAEGEFDSLITVRDRLILVDFHASWCGPCKSLGPKLENAAHRHGGRVILAKVDVDGHGELVRRFGVSSIPDVRIYLNGVQAGRFVGDLSTDEIEGVLAPLVAKLPAGAATGDGAGAETPAEPAIQPMRKDWMPEGMERR